MTAHAHYGKRRPTVFSILSSPTASDFIEDISITCDGMSAFQNSKPVVWKQVMHPCGTEAVRAKLTRQKENPFDVKPRSLRVLLRHAAGQQTPAEHFYSRLKHAIRGTRVDSAGFDMA